MGVLGDILAIWRELVADLVEHQPSRRPPPMTTTENETKTVVIPMSERRPLKVRESEWPVIATAHEWDGQHECQANRHWRIKVRQHANGRTVVYGYHTTAFQGERSLEGGYLLEPDVARTDELIRAIRRVAGIIDRPELAQSVISDLPAEDL
jgi:hypothetical protein